MSFAALDWAWRVKTGNAGRKAVLMALAQFADDEGMCWPSQETIAVHSELSERSVRDHLSWLEEAGYLVRSERRWADSKKRRSDLYQLQIGFAPVDSAGGKAAKTKRKNLPVGGDGLPANSAGSSEDGAGLDSAGVDGSDTGCPSSAGEQTNRQILPVAPTGNFCSEPPANFAGYESPALISTTTTAPERSRVFAMHEAWEPDAGSLRYHLQTAGLALEEITQELVAEFVGFWLTQPAEETHANWCRKLVTQAKRVRAQAQASAGTVVSFPAGGRRGSAAAPDFGDQSWRAMTEHDL